MTETEVKKLVESLIKVYLDKTAPSIIATTVRSILVSEYDKINEHLKSALIDKIALDPILIQNITKETKEIIVDKCVQKILTDRLIRDCQILVKEGIGPHIAKFVKRAAETFETLMIEKK